MRYMKTKVWGILLVAVVLLTLSVVYLLRSRNAEKGAAVPSDAPTYFVYKADRKVLVVQDRPGYLKSTAYLPGGRTPPRHPFVSARSLDPLEEDALREILLKSADFSEFVVLLTENGYKVEPAPSAAL